MTYVITKLFDRLDKICERRYGHTRDRIVEFVLEQNPGLEVHGMLLPPGIRVELPNPPEKKTRSVRQTIRLV